ncbi:MAG: hypothetical protein WBA12_05925 [Catalinimonas sp.]
MHRKRLFSLRALSNFLKIWCGVLLLGCLWSAAALGQNHYRMRADFTIKEKNADSTSSLVMGTVYYDKFEKRIVYQVNFPQAETWVHADTSVYRLVDGQVQDRQSLPNIIEFTMFHLALNQNLTDFGMKNSVFKIGEVRRVGDQVLTTWSPPAKLAKQFGEVVVAQNNKQLAGLAVYNPDGELLSRQVVKKHLRAGNFSFPGQIVQVTDLEDGRKQYRITTFRNLVVNEEAHDDVYRAAGLAP